ncbi:MAG TPA: ferrochelatase [Terriglobales bacterium]|jgi:protoporphyrin/coproporphyrin ferrochelatase|nr:ferrochelatase [Terriglobales bacterium]
MNDCRIGLGDNCYCKAQTNGTAASQSKSAVLLLAHGSPDNADEIPAFLSSITGGRPLPPHVIEEVRHRYSLIGFSPLTCWTRLQAAHLSRLLKLPVYIGMRNWKPFVSETVQQIAAEGRERVVAICLAPQNSRTSVGLYRRAVTGEAEPPFALDFVESWHDHPLLAQAFAQKLRDGWKKACAESGTKVPIIFTAHSVPERTISEGDPYKAQSHETAELVANEAGLSPNDWTFAFQSQGMSGGAWIGPTVEEAILGLKEKGHIGVFIQPIGFLCDHVEVLYDVDIAFREFANKEGMKLWRAGSLNDSLLLTEALADIARGRM